MFTTLITQPITNVLVAIYQLLVTLGIPFALGFAIILLTVLIRLLLYPLISQQLRASKKMQEIQPHVNKLKEKHKNDANTSNCFFIIVTAYGDIQYLFGWVGV